MEIDFSIELAAGIAYFFNVFAKAFQQRNVAFMNYLLAVPTSYILSTSDVLVWSLIVWKASEAESLWGLVSGMALMVFTIGTGGALGSVAAMFIHHKYFTKKRFR